MPVANPPATPAVPAQLASSEVSVIKEIVSRYYGGNVVVRNYGPDPQILKIHIETEGTPGLEQYDVAGEILARIDRKEIGVTVTKRASRHRGEAKVAYRQGVIL